MNDHLGTIGLYPNCISWADPFRCDQESSIAIGLVCNGVKDCANGADETYFCHSMACPPPMQRCDYGACVRDLSICGMRQGKSIQS